jgi:biopolymer transport protein ExbD
MKIKTPGPVVVDIDMTPMIDMTFQLIAFFMILVNFTETEQDERVQLPSSTLAKPPEAALETPITIQLTRDGKVLMLGHPPFASADAIRPILSNEEYVLRSQGKAASSATIVIRAHKDAKTGQVQELIKVCQEEKFEKFTLRAKEDVGN